LPHVKHSGVARAAALAAGFALLWGLGLWPHFVPLWAAIPGGVIFFVAAHLVSRWLGLGGLPGLGFTRIGAAGRQLGLGLVAGGLAIVLYVIVALGTGRWERVGFRPLDEMQGLLLLTLLNTAYIGFWEETLCRGYLIRAIGGRHGIATLALISGAAFVPFHFTQFGTVPQYFLLYWFLSGVAFALPLLITGSLWISVGMHWGHNLLFALFLTRDGWMIAERAATPPPFSKYLLLVVAVAKIPLAWGASRLAIRRDEAAPRGPEDSTRPATTNAHANEALHLTARFARRR